MSTDASEANPPRTDRALLLSRFEDAEVYAPPGHRGAVNRLLVGMGMGGITEVSVWHGRIEPNGGADPHRHATSLQIYACLSGQLAVSTGDSETTLDPGDVLLIFAGVEHDLLNRGDDVATLLVISSPALR